MGVFEMDCFAKGTKEIAEALADSSAISIVGGGDSVTAAKKFNVQDKLSFCSNGRRRFPGTAGRQGASRRGSPDRQVRLLLPEVTVHGRRIVFRMVP